MWTPVLRPAAEIDGLFLRHLYGQTRVEEMGLAEWPPDQSAAFLDAQFELQFRHYSAHYGDGRHLIVEIAGRTVGRFWTCHLDDGIQVVDISLLPDWRNRGIGSALLRETMAQARRQGIGVRLEVLMQNIDARRLYERLGFRATDSSGARSRMLWTSPQIS